MSRLVRLRRQRRVAAGGAPAPAIRLSAATVSEDADIGTTIGALSVANGSGSYTFSEAADPDGKFVVSGTSLNIAAALDYETAASHPVTIRADNGVDDPISRTFVIAVTNLFEQPALSALALSTIEVTQGQSVTINILGATAGSTITANALPAGLALNSAARTIGGAPTTLGSRAISLTETLADSPNSPRVSAVSIEVVQAPAEPARAVFLAIGDSLMPGVGNLDSNRTSADPEVLNSVQWVNRSGRPNNQQLDTDVSPIWFPSNDVGRISPVEKMLIDYNALSGEATAIIPLAVAGSSLEGAWNPTVPGANLTNGQAAHNAAMAQLKALNPDTYVAGVIINLTSNGLAGYTEVERRPLWLGLIDYLRASFDHIDDSTPFFIGGPVKSGASGGSARALIEAIAAERINCFVVHPPYPTVNGDNLHPTMAEGRQWGMDIATTANAVNNGGGQAIPTFVGSSAFAIYEGETLNALLGHTGLSNVNPYGVIEIAPGGDGDLFAIGGTFHAPRLVEANPGATAVGTYTVPLRIRNGAWNYGPVTNYTVTIAEVVSEDLTIHSGYFPTVTYTSNQNGAPYGELWVPDFQIRTGDNYIYFLGGSGTFKADISLTVNDNPATLVAKTTATSNAAMYRYTSASDTTGTLKLVHGGSPLSGMGFGSFVVLGGGAPTDTALQVWHNSAVTAWESASLTLPEGGLIVVAGRFGLGVTSADAPSVLLPGTPGGYNNQMVVASRDSAGAITLNGSKNFVGWFTLAIPPAS